MSYEEEIRQTAQSAAEAARKLATLGSDVKNRAIVRVAERLLLGDGDAIKAANKKDLDRAKNKGLSDVMIDRLTITDMVLRSMSEALIDVASLPDPVGEVSGMWRRPNGLLVGKVRIPLGVIGIIYESRPNVTADAAGLCLKSGNAVILRGGSEAINSNLAIVKVLQEVCREEGLPEGAVQMVPTMERDAVLEMLKLDQYIDLIIPRGGERLIRFVVDNSRIPVIKHYKGVCHVYVDESTDMEMAEEIVFNAKVQRPGVCNAVETLLVHESVAPEFLPKIGARLETEGVEIRGCEETRKFLSSAVPAIEEDWSTEYLGLILAVRVVKSMDQAIDHISRYGSLHTDAIVTKDYANAQRFLREVGSSTVLVNASTRFSDGHQLGLGAEIGISTTKLHAFGPMGLDGLTTQKFIVYGNGQIRG